jgi:DNA-binding response OmpR family regulator
LILLDWNLIGLHGSKVLQEIRQDPALQKSFVAILTASSSEIDRQLAHKLGANKFLTKSIDVDEFFFSLLELQALV